MKKYTKTVVGLVMALVVGFAFTMAQAEEAKKAPAPQATEKQEVKAMSVVMKGKIEAVGQAFILKTPEQKEYKLQGKDLKAHVGKNVQVKGMLDQATQTINVEEITPAQ